MMFKFFAALLFVSGTAIASTSPIEFSALDLDGSGGLSLSEVQAAASETTAEEFAEFDEDGSGELSEIEYAAWATTSSEG